MPTLNNLLDFLKHGAMQAATQVSKQHVALTIPIGDLSQDDVLKAIRKGLNAVTFEEHKSVTFDVEFLQRYQPRYVTFKNDGSNSSEPETIGNVVRLTCFTNLETDLNHDAHVQKIIDQLAKANGSKLGAISVLVDGRYCEAMSVQYTAQASEYFES